MLQYSDDGVHFSFLQDGGSIEGKGISQTPFLRRKDVPSGYSGRGSGYPNYLG